MLRDGKKEKEKDDALVTVKNSERIAKTLTMRSQGKWKEGRQASEKDTGGVLPLESIHTAIISGQTDWVEAEENVKEENEV